MSEYLTSQQLQEHLEQFAQKIAESIKEELDANSVKIEQNSAKVDDAIKRLDAIKDALN